MNQYIIYGKLAGPYMHTQACLVSWCVVSLFLRFLPPSSDLPHDAHRFCPPTTSRTRSQHGPHRLRPFRQPLPSRSSASQSILVSQRCCQQVLKARNTTAVGASSSSQLNFKNHSLFSPSYTQKNRSKHNGETRCSTPPCQSHQGW